MISVCAEMFYFRKMDFYSRLEKLKSEGAEAIEFWLWSDKDIQKLKEIKNKLGLKILGFCVDSSDGARSECVFKNILTLGKKEEFLEALKETKKVYDELDAEYVIATFGDKNPGMSFEEQIDNVKACLEYVKPYLEAEGMKLLLEPINPEERPDYILPRAADGFEILKELGSHNIKMLYDIYHQNMTGDFDMVEITENIDYIGHFHIADVPGRNEPGTGNVDYQKIVEEIGKTAYRGSFGYEFFPTDTFTFYDITK